MPNPMNPKSPRSSAARARRHDPGGKSRPPWPEDSVVAAEFSPCGRYRYWVSEVWDAGKPAVMWVLMNPSVACVDHSDPTLRRTGTYARDWGYGGQVVTNVHAYRATDKNRLLDVDDPVGPENDRWLVEVAAGAGRVVLAFGKPPRPLQPRGMDVIRMLAAGSALYCLRLLKDGVTPEHPLYLPRSLRPRRYPG